MNKFLLVLAGAALTSQAQGQTVIHYWDFESTTDVAGGLATTAVGTPDMSIHATYGEALPGLGKSLNTALSGTAGGGGFLSADVHDGVSATAFDLGTTDFSFSYWTYDANDGDARGPRIFDCLATTTTGIQLGTNATPVFNLRLDDHEGGSTISNNTLAIMPSAGVWVHVAVTIDRANFLGEIYFDGVSQGTFPMLSTATGVIRPTQDLLLGVINGGGDAAAAQEAGLDDLAFYDGLLSASDVAGLANGTLTPLSFGGGVSGSEYCAEAVHSCPCFVVSNIGEGCPNSTGAGATMVGAGVPSVGASSFSLTAAQLPDTVGLFVQGTNAVGGADGNPVGEGRLCLGPQKRYAPQAISGGSVSRSNFQNFATAGSAMNYQFWYRDPQNVCNGGGFNFGPAWNVTWGI